VGPDADTEPPPMSRLTRRLPDSIKHLAPVVRERDVLRAKVLELREQLNAERDRPPAPAPVPSSPAPRVHGTYVGGGRVLVGPKFGGRLLLPSDDLTLMPELVTEGVYDVPFTAYVQRHVKPGDTVIDVGANVGLFTLLLGFEVWEYGRVLAYEANPRIVELLRDNVSMNWLNDRVEIIPKAAAATHGELEFIAPQRFSVTGSLQPVEHLLVSDDRVDTLERITVPAEPLDVHAGRFERIALIKIDVEGAEEQVFAGMTGLLEAGVVEHVSFEVADEYMGADWGPFAARLRDLHARGWSFATIASDGSPEPIEVDAVIAKGRFSQVLMSTGG
jgi:FkbM family methyltransferase